MPKQTQKKGHGSGTSKRAVSGGGRQKSSRGSVSVNISGPLGMRLRGHAFERCRHFFLFVTTLRQIEYLNNHTTGRALIDASKMFEKKATHQIDDGFRSEQSEHIEFRRDDDMIVDETSTAFARVDAAHYCNLGIKPALASSIDRSNQVISDLYENLKVYAGNTTWLPQIVNIGPDRIIDKLHGELAESFLKDGNAAICSRTRIQQYIAAATLALGVYVLNQTKTKNYGKVACAKCYLAAYVEKETVTFGTTPQVTRELPDFAEKIFASMSGSIAGWCEATNNNDQALRNKLLSFS